MSGSGGMTTRLFWMESYWAWDLAIAWHLVAPMLLLRLIARMFVLPKLGAKLRSCSGRSNYPLHLYLRGKEIPLICLNNVTA